MKFFVVVRFLRPSMFAAIALVILSPFQALLKAQDPLEDADAAYRAGQFAEAERLYAAIAAKGKKNYSAALKLGSLALLSNRLREFTRAPQFRVFHISPPFRY